MLLNKKVFFVRALAIFTLLTLSASADQNPFVKPFPFKEGVITYAVRGNHKGSKTIYFSDYGRKQLIIENTHHSILQKISREKRVTLILPESKYIIDINHHHAEKTPLLSNILYKKFQKLTKRSQEKVLANFKKSNPRSVYNLDGSCISHAKTILGKPCTLENIDGIEQCSIARGALILEESLHLLGYHIEWFATSLQERKVDANLFRLPDDIHITVKKNHIDQEADKILTTLEKKALLCNKHAGGSATPHLQRVMFDEIKSLSESF